MTGFYKRAYNEFENQINELLIEQENQLASYEKVIAIIVQKLGKLKEYVLKTAFKNQQEEIHFFKHVKPQFISVDSIIRKERTLISIGSPRGTLFNKFLVVGFFGKATVKVLLQS